MNKEKCRFVCDEAYNKNNTSNDNTFGSEIKIVMITYLILIILKINFIIIIPIDLI